MKRKKPTKSQIRDALTAFAPTDEAQAAVKNLYKGDEEKEEAAAGLARRPQGAKQLSMFSS